MSVDVFKPRELTDISSLAVLVEKFNREQDGDAPLFAEVTLYRGGDDVATLTDSRSFGDAAAGALSFEVKEKS